MKNKKTTFILFIAIIIFTTSIVPKVFQNDTFFAIAIGDLILDNGIDMMEHFTWHEDMTYCYSHWLFDIIIALINSNCGFTGIYIFTIIMANITAIALFRVLTKRKNNEIISFVITLLTVWLGWSMFSARAQIISFVLFIIEIFCIEQFLESNKKRYITTLLIIPIIIANVHAAVWPMYFVIYLPYIAEYILSQLSFEKIFERKSNRALKKLQDKNITDKVRSKYQQTVEKAEKFKNKEYNPKFSKIIIEENKNIKILIIIMLIAILTGFITTIGEVPFTYMIKQIENKYVSAFINEMKPLVPISDVSFMILVIIYISMLTFTDTKVKLSDGLFILGFIFMTLCSVRSIYYLVWICAIPLARIINSFMYKYGKKELESLANNLNKLKIQMLLIFLIIICSLNLYTNRNLGVDYVDEESYPVGATEYILNNLDVNNMKLYNGYNYGSYLEMKEIPVFIDSRADIWCEEFNNTTVLEDEYNLRRGIKNYKEIFEKYNITHALVYKEDIIDIYMSIDNDYKVIYEDENFVLYEHKTANIN